MNCEYFCKKNIFEPRKIEMAQIFFANGDFMTLKKREIIDLAITFYDELCVGERGFCPVVKSGFIKCKIQSKHNGSMLVCENSEYGDNAKEYFENRCIKENGIRYMRVFDENCWHVPFYCLATARKQDDFLIFEFQEGISCGSAENSCHTLRARSVTKKNIEKILLDFENCEDFEIFPEEIKDMQLNFEEELEWGSDTFNRKVRNGYIRLKFDKEIIWRMSNMESGKGKDTVAKLEKRLCGNGKAPVDICRLYVTYDYAGYGMCLEERIEMENICSADTQEDSEEAYISGYAEKQKDGSVLIVFGK